MSQFVEVKTAELVGPALDWSVAKAAGVELVEHRGIDLRVEVCHGLATNYAPSANWNQGGPLLDIYDIALNGGVVDGERATYATLRAVADDAPFATSTGPTRLIAACRAIVAAKLGYVVQVPVELAGVEA